MTTTLGRLLRLAAPFAGWMTLAAGLGAATVLSSVGLLATSAYLISAAALRPSIAELSVAIVGVRFFGLARGVFRYLERYVSHSVNFRLLARLRVWFYTAIEPLTPAQLLGHQSGDLLARAVSDVETLQDFFVRVAAPPAVAALIALVLAAGLWIVHPVLTLLFLVFAALAGLALPVLLRRLAHAPAQRMVAARAELHAQLVDDLNGLADLAANGQEERALARMEQATADYARQQRRLAWINGLQSGLSGLLANGAMWAILAAGVALTAAGQLDGVYLAALALATSASFEAILPLPLAAQSLETALAAARRLFAAADTPPAVSDPPRPAPAPATGALEVRGLSLAYAPSGPLSVREVSFDLPPGKHLAVVGPSGAGKSTLLSALVRLCDPAAGQVRLDGLDLRAYAQADVRRSMTLVGQTPHLFNASIEDNLRLGRPQATEAEVTRAAEQAQLQDFIASLPEGGATWIGERGVRLSAGQRQRLALARALLRDTPVLILDEPTAHLDTATERALLRALLEARRGRALILATHRLVGLEAMDEILVLDRGQIVQRGRHAELAAAPGLYRRLWELQNRAALPRR